MSLGSQIIYLFIIAIPVACVAWTVTQEEIFREPREYCQKVCGSAKSIVYYDDEFTIKIKGLIQMNEEEIQRKY